MKMRIPTPHQHFGQLREKIHDRLRVLRPPHWEEQIDKHPWLYGALGDPEADVMFICENPSLTGVRKARSPLGGPCDFDTQWTGDPARRPDKRFRTVLCDLGLKEGGIWERGGWKCYITNVIKQAEFVRDWNDPNKVSPADKRRAARKWSRILQWEFDMVCPKIMFYVGRQAEDFVRRLVREGRFDPHGVPAYYIRHYSRGGDEGVERKMREGIEPYL